MATGLLRAGVAALAVVFGVAGFSGNVLAQSSAGDPSTTESGSATESAQGGLDNSGGGFGNETPATGKGGDTSTEDPAAGKEVRTEPDEESVHEVEPDAATEQMAVSATATVQPIDNIGAIPKASMPGEMGSAGNLTYDIAIDVPAFRGLEPSIGLNYNSSRRTKLGSSYQGWLGYGWGLDGFDVIERASPGYGVPAFGADDVYLLNGAELVLCADAAAGSPSCAAGVGGTHTTEVESYRRVTVSGAAGPSRVWKVTDRDGTVSTFKTVAALSGVTPTSGSSAYILATNRWLLATVTDTYNNTVAYSYACPDMGASPLTAVCYPNTISYIGAVITFLRETRPDVILMANGYDISATKQRIKTISIKSGGALRSAYTLTYDQAPFSNASRLTLVELHGLHGDVDAAISAAGVVTGAVKKRIASFDYQDSDASYTALTSSASPVGRNFPQNQRPLGAADLDFDGRDELSGVTTTTWSETTSDPGGSSSGTTTTNYTRYDFKTTRFKPDGQVLDSKSTTLRTNSDNQVYQSPAGVLSGRFNAAKNATEHAFTEIIQHVQHSHDGADRVTGYTANNFILQSDGELTLSKVACGSVSVPYQAVCAALPVGGGANGGSGNIFGYQRFAEDFDGDGVDMLYERYAVGTYVGDLGTGDFWANGRRHRLVQVGNDQYRKAQLVNGAWQYSGATIWLQDGGVLADVNGDGATDIISGHATAQGATGPGDFTPKVYLSTGQSFKQVAMPTAISSQLVLRDYDNDGKADFVSVDCEWEYEIALQRGHCRETGTTKVYALRFGPSANSLALVTTFGVKFSPIIGDFNGDGLPDFFNATSLYASSPGTGSPNLLRTVVNELGATVSVDYSPSSYWSNGYMPQVLHGVTKLSVNDGRGQVAQTRYAYSGGKYDPKARKFLGYQKVIETKPLANGETTALTVETTYRQDLASYRN